MRSPSEDDEAHGWLFLKAASLPERWRERGVDVVLVPLLPDEAARLLRDGKAVEPELGADEEALLRLVAQGHSIRSMAGELRLPHRTVERRLARLRESFGVRTKGELATRLARDGWGRSRQAVSEEEAQETVKNRPSGTHTP